MEGLLAHPLPRDATLLLLLESLCAIGRSARDRGETAAGASVLEPDDFLTLLVPIYIYIYVLGPQPAAGGRKPHHLSKEECRNVAPLVCSFGGVGTGGLLWGLRT